MIKMSKATVYTIIGTLIAAALLPWIVPFNNYMMCILVSFCYFTITASSLNLLLGYTGQVSMGHNAFMCIGAYSYGIFCANYKFFGSQLIGFLLGIIIPFIFGLFIGIGCSRLSAIFLATATGAFAKGLKAFLVAEAWLTGGPNGLTGIPKLKFFGIEKLQAAAYNRILFYISLVMAFVMVLFCWRLINSRTGRAFQAIRTSPIAAAAMGINVTGYKFLVCGISAAMAGLSGIIYAWNFSYVSPDIFDKFGTRLMTMAVTGGMATIPGPIIGAVIMAILPELLRVFAIHLDGIYGILVIIVFLIIPTGFYGAFNMLRGWVMSMFKKPAAAAAGEGESS